MVSTVTQIFWRQPWAPAAEAALSTALHSLGLSLRDLPNQCFDLSAGTVGGARISQCAFRAPAGPAWSCLHLPGDSNRGEELAAALARHTSQPVLVLTEFDQVAWGFSVNHPPETPLHFHSLASLMEGVPSPGDIDLAALSRILEVGVERLAPYLRPQSPDEVSGCRAFPDDQFVLGDPWVRVDFLCTIGITYSAPADTPAGRFCLLVPSPPGALDRPDSHDPERRVEPVEPSILRRN